MRLPRPVALLAIPALAVTLSACQAKDNGFADGSGDQSIDVVSSDDGCDVSTEDAPSGNLQFSVTNEGSQVTEFYLYGEDGLRIVGEVENIGPGLTRDLVVRAAPGDYVASCRPGMSGDGIRSDFAVSDSGEDVSIEGVDQATIDQAMSQYSAYVRDQSSQLVDKTQQFVDAYTSGDDDEARRLYPVARTHWEGIETVAESFGDLDPKTDLREADLEDGQEWTGWHLLEKDLWPPASGYQPLSDADRATYAADLMKNINTLDKRVQDLEFTVDQVSNGSKGLLDEVATGKITGEEDIWSHTDLWDFQANVDGARVAYETLQPLLEVKDPDLSKEIGRRFDALQTLLDQHRDGDGFVFYDTVGEPERKQLSQAVDALSEPLSKMTGALTL